MKQEVKEYIPIYLSPFSILEGTLEVVAQNILDIKAQVAQQAPHLPIYDRIEMELNCHESYGDVETEFSLHGIRLETDQELNIRLEREYDEKQAEERRKKTLKKAREAKKKRDLEKEKKLFLKLKQKYESEGV